MRYDEDRSCVETTGIRAADFLQESRSDSDAIDLAVEEAERTGIRSLLLDGRTWLLDRAVEVPSDFRVIVDGVTVKTADSVYDNLFRPRGVICRPGDPFGFPARIDVSRQIRIRGIHGAVLEGPDVHPRMWNPVACEEQDMIGDIWGWRGFLILMTRCIGFEISGFRVRKTRTWAISVERSSDGLIRDLDFQTTCRNGDGVNLRVGCSRIRIENISGSTADDTVAVNSGASPMEYPFKQYVFPLIPSDYLRGEGEPIEERFIHDVEIRGIRTRDYCPAVAFLSNAGHKITRVSIRDVFDLNPVSRPRRIYMVGLYYTDYGPGFREGDVSEISIDHVVSNSAEQAVIFRLPVRGLSISRVTQRCPEGVVLLATKDNLCTALPDCVSSSGRMTSSAEDWTFREEEWRFLPCFNQ